MRQQFLGGRLASASGDQQMSHALTTAVYVFSVVLVAVLAGAALLSFRSSRV